MIKLKQFLIRIMKSTIVQYILGKIKEDSKELEAMFLEEIIDEIDIPGISEETEKEIYRAMIKSGKKTIKRYIEKIK